jgi:hypothetical protein
LTRSTNKYNAKKTVIDGIEFDSKKEARRFAVLKSLESAGMISDLQRQVEFVLIPEQREPDTIGSRGGIHKGKVIERKCSYIADFVYRENGNLVVEDAKGMRLPDYVIKRKLLLYIHGLRIREV